MKQPLLSSAPNRSILALDEALTAFSQVAPRQVKVVEFRYFGGLMEDFGGLMEEESSRL